jgi:hypothetical protein
MVKAIHLIRGQSCSEALRRDGREHDAITVRISGLHRRLQCHAIARVDEACLADLGRTTLLITEEVPILV